MRRRDESHIYDYEHLASLKKHLLVFAFWVRLAVPSIVYVGPALNYDVVHSGFIVGASS